MPVPSSTQIKLSSPLPKPKSFSLSTKQLNVWSTKQGTPKACSKRLRSGTYGSFGELFENLLQRLRVDVRGPPGQSIEVIAPEDLVRYGMIPEFIGRLPVVSVLDPLTEEDLERVLLRTKNALVKQYAKLFAIDGVRLKFTADAVKAIAHQAVELKTGARALRSIMEKTMLEVMFDLPQRDDVTEVVIDAGVVAGRKRPTLRRAGKNESRADAA